MRKRTKLAVGAGTALAVVGSGAAIGATKLTPREESTAVLEDAAKQLGVEPERLGDALTKALENRIDEAVKAGRLTEEQGARMKQRLQSEDFPLLAGPLFGGHRGPHGHHPGGRIALDTAAEYLGVSEVELRRSLRAGESLADVAKEEGKAVAGLVDALVAAQTARLDEAVAAGRITKERRDEIVAGLEERVTGAVNGVRPAFEGKRGKGGSGFRGHHAPEPPPPAA